MTDELVQGSEPAFHPHTTEAPAPTPAPTGTKARKPRGPARKAGTAKRGPGRPRKAAATPQPGNLADMAADAAAEALAKEPKGAGRPTTASTKDASLEAGLRNFYIGTGAMMSMAGQWFKNDRLAQGGAAMMAQAQDCAAALVVWSNASPPVRRALEHITVAGGASVVVAAHAPIAMALMGFAQPIPMGPAPVDGEPVDLSAMGGFDLGKLAEMGAALLASDQT